MLIKNPFIHGKVVEQDLYCPRPKEEKELLSNILSGQNTYVIGERRVGKTSLVSYCLKNNKLKQKMLYVEVDFKAVSSKMDVQSRILKAILKTANEIKDWEWFRKIFTRLRPTSSIADDGKSFVYSFTFEPDVLDNLSLLEIFDYIEKTNKRQNVVVFFDEFPDILKIESGKTIFGEMRSKIQTQSFPYIFAGSHRGEMRKIFEDPDYVFYSSAAPLIIENFEVVNLGKFCIKKFELGNRELNMDIFDFIYNQVEGNTGHVFQLCHEIWDLTNKNDFIDFETVHRGLEEICQKREETFTELVNGLNDNQKKTLQGFVLTNGKNIYTKQFLKNYKIKSIDDVKNSINALIHKNILYKKNNKEIFYNPFLKFWLNQLYK